MNKTLHAIKSRYADAGYQLEVLSGTVINNEISTSFREKLTRNGLFQLKSRGVDVFQVNIGKMCNQVCNHCHVDAGPDRQEVMTRTTMNQCLKAVKNSNAGTIDITGGAPEMNPDFRWFVAELSKLNRKIIVRCNLTIIVAGKEYNDLPEFFRKHKIEVISSLPSFNERETDLQRGEGVFSDSVEALKKLNEVGYGIKGSGLLLNLVYNPKGTCLPCNEKEMQAQFKSELKKHFDIEFNDLFAFTNIPVSRFLNFLVESGNLTSYMNKLVSSFNPAAAENVMCRNTISIGWDGCLYDCDFNQMLELKVNTASRPHISEYNEKELNSREIVVNQHCYGCTAGAGSSCGGQLLS
jgi:radical SAM/Cys-rich protein